MPYINVCIVCVVYNVCIVYLYVGYEVYVLYAETTMTEKYAPHTYMQSVQCIHNLSNAKVI